MSTLYQKAEFFGVEGDRYSTSETVPSGGSDSVTLQPPVDEIWDIIQLYVWADAIGTSGDHQFNIRTYKGGDILIEHLFGKSAYGDLLLFCNGYWRIATSSQRPTTEIGCIREMENLVATNAQPVKIDYTNNTDENQTSRRYGYNYKKYKIVPAD